MSCLLLLCRGGRLVFVEVEEEQEEETSFSPHNEE